MQNIKTTNDEMNIVAASDVDPNLLRMLDRGIDDVLAGRTLSHKEAMEEVKKIRSQRRLKNVQG